MPYVLAETYQVKRPFTVLGHKYMPGEFILGKDLVHVRSADVLLSRRFVIPQPDPFSRTTDPSTPTPTPLPATVRKQVAKGATVLATEQEAVEDAGPPDPVEAEPEIEAPVAEDEAPAPQPPHVQALSQTSRGRRKKAE